MSDPRDDLATVFVVMRAGSYDVPDYPVGVFSTEQAATDAIATKKAATRYTDMAGRPMPNTDIYHVESFVLDQEGLEII